MASSAKKPLEGYPIRLQKKDSKAAQEIRLREGQAAGLYFPKRPINEKEFFTEFVDAGSSAYYMMNLANDTRIEIGKIVATANTEKPEGSSLKINVTTRLDQILDALKKNGVL